MGHQNHSLFRKLKFCAAVLSISIISQQGFSMSEDQFEDTISEVRTLAESGELKKAEKLVNNTVATELGLTREQSRDFRFELVRIERIRKDYWLTEEKLREWLLDKEKGATNYSDDMFEKLEDQGFFDFKFIDGEKRYIGASRANLFFRNPNIRSKSDKIEASGWQKLAVDEIEKVKQEYDPNSVPPARARHFELTYTLTVKPENVEEGEFVECWIPFPHEFAYQKDIELISSSPEVHSIAPPDYPMRSLYFQHTVDSDEPIKFQATWRMTRLPQHTDVVPSLVPIENKNPDVAIFTKEQAPHVMFTNELVQLEKKIAGNLQNPAEKARAYYDWMSENITYSYAREYSTLQNISQYVYDNKYGDCGQIALMYITLCRIGGIPARWSSGWNIYPNYVGIHDWAEIYLEPYGWIHVDANWGIYSKAHDQFEGMSEETRAKVADYYFGGIDAYRFTANRNHGIQFTPPKTDFRSDTVDFQRGEVEVNNRNLYYGQFRYDLDVKYLDGHSDLVYEIIEEQKREAEEKAKKESQGN